MFWLTPVDELHLTRPQVFIYKGVLYFYKSSSRRPNPWTQGLKPIISNTMTEQQKNTANRMFIEVYETKKPKFFPSCCLLRTQG